MLVSWSVAVGQLDNTGRHVDDGLGRDVEPWVSHVDGSAYIGT